MLFVSIYGGAAIMVDLRRFHVLRPEARAVVHSLFEQSLEARGPFERFTILWMSFNGWMNCVTAGDNDAAMIAALAKDLDLAERFERRVLRGPSGEILQEFAAWWPIYDVKSVRRHVGVDGVFRYRHRTDFHEAHRLNSKIRRRPDPWVEGQSPRWGEFLAAAYQVRCNLFHGDKSTANSGDIELVRLAHEGLLSSIQILDLFDLGISNDGFRGRDRRIADR